ncbi:hypothetical protein ACLQ24_21575 [Micromonospora sp. DT4]|uniref:hypothetical protein n=1 Tax=Micromonospora sp. DT4 TaxID=3393438 RepID=UPI003CF22263
MILAPMHARFASDRRRLDAAYFCSPGIQAMEALTRIRESGVSTALLADKASVFHPNRFKRLPASRSEEKLPFLRAFDVFEFLPQPAGWISARRTEKLDSLRVDEGQILLTRSGRNLGPSVLVDSYLSDFIPSDDLLRITFSDQTFGYYAYAFLRSAPGQDLLRQDKTGSVIDHLSADQVGSQLVPVFDEIFSQVAAAIERSVTLRGTARRTLSDALNEADQLFAVDEGSPLRDGWTTRASSLMGRIDAAYHQHRVEVLRRSLLSAGGTRLGDVAAVLKPGGRYKTYYVGHEHGRPLLSGRNLLQAWPIGLKSISTRSIPEGAGYELAPGWICFQADGRAEEKLGFPILVTSDRAGWLASGHVARVIPNVGTDPGWLWTALASNVVQTQISAIACGSVVDALYEDDVRRIVLPPPTALTDGGEVTGAWEAFATASQLEANAIELVEKAFSQRAGLLEPHGGSPSRLPSTRTPVEQAAARPATSRRP